MQPFPVDVPRISREVLFAASAIRQLLDPTVEQRLATWGLRMLGQSVTVERVYAASPGVVEMLSSTPGSVGAVVLGRHDGQTGALFLDGNLVAAILGGLLKAPWPPVLGALGPAEQALLDHAIASLLGALAPAAPLYVLPDAERPTLARRGLLEAPVRIGDLRGLCWLAWAGSLPRAPTRRDPTRLARVSASIGAQLARMTLPHAEVSALATGDLIVSDSLRPPLSVGDPLRLVVGRGRGHFESRVQGPSQIVVHSRFMGESTMVDGDTDMTLADALPVDISVELARIELSGASLMQLRPGDVVTLDRPLSAAVSLRVAGRLMAHGELVDVDGEAAVRLTEIFD